jgi:hypothetical protein
VLRKLIQTSTVFCTTFLLVTKKIVSSHLKCILNAKFFLRYLNDEELQENETVMIESIKEDDKFTLTFIGNIKNRVGKIRLVAKNSGGEAITEATLTVYGRPPVFLEKPFTSQVLAGKCYSDFFGHTALRLVRFFVQTADMMS